MSQCQLEIAVQDLTGVTTAIEGGADRIELCQALEVGGLTPSAGLIAGAVELAESRDGFVNVLVRPRAGGFVHTAAEVDVMVRDIQLAADAGAHGIVIGALAADNDIDRDALERLTAAADGLTVTFHRAIDVLDDPASAVSALAELGVHRVLTSGGAVRSGDGVDVLERMVRASGGTVEIMAGGGVSVEVIPALVGIGVDAVHLSAKAPGATRGLAGPGGGEDAVVETSPEIVAAARAAVDSASIATSAVV